jgi:subtilisin family serine protease
MNRQTFGFHLGLAVILVVAAALAGQVKRWQENPLISEDRLDAKAVKPAKSAKQIVVTRPSEDSEPEALVKFRSDLSISEIKRIVAKNNDTVEDAIETVNNLVSIDDLDGLSAEEVARQYAGLGALVQYAEPNYKINLDPQLGERSVTEEDIEDVLTLPNDPMFNEQWALSNTGMHGGKEKADLGALEAWQTTKGSRKIVVAVLDSGVDYTHPDLMTNMWTRPDSVPAYKDANLGAIQDMHGFNASANIADPMDELGHGTHCAGVIGAEGDNGEGISGVNWEVEIMPLKFLGSWGFGTTKDAIEAINYAIDRKRAGVNLRVINASFGSTEKSKALEDVIRAAGEEGILFVAAAGNNGSSNDSSPHYPANYNLPNVISVAALDRTDKLASFSNFGAKTVHIAAPGKDILSTWLDGAYREASGTSMAAPQVSGVAALLLAKNPRMSVQKLREKLLDSVDQIGPLNGKLVNAGRVNAAKALHE